MARVAIVSHNRDVGMGRLASHLAAHEAVDVWAPDAEFPDDVDAAVVLGGFMGAYETTDHPWLEDEKKWIARLVERNAPVLGICLGSQLIADSLGGRAYQAPFPEAGVVDVELTAAGKAHPVVGALGKRALLAHQDTFDLPPGAILLARTVRYPTAFEKGSALAVQSHPETPTEKALTWPDHPEFEMLERAGSNAAEFTARLNAHADELAASAEAMFGAWFGSFRAEPAGGGERPKTAN